MARINPDIDLDELAARARAGGSFSMKELGAVEGCGQTFLYHQVKDGKLKVCKLGQRVFVTQEQRQAWKAGGAR